MVQGSKSLSVTVAWPLPAYPTSSRRRFHFATGTLGAYHRETWGPGCGCLHLAGLLFRPRVLDARRHTSSSSEPCSFRVIGTSIRSRCTMPLVLNRDCFVFPSPFDRGPRRHRLCVGYGTKSSQGGNWGEIFDRTTGITTGPGRSKKGPRE